MNDIIWIVGISLLGLILLMIIVFLLMQVQSMGKRKSMKVMQEMMESQNQEMKLLLREQQQSMEKMKDRFSTQLLEFANMTQQQILMMSRHMSEDLQESKENTATLFQQVLEQVTRVDESSKSLQRVSGQLNDLQLILNDKKMRGIFGEIELYTLLENVYGDAGVRYQKQMKLSTGVIADCALTNAHMPIICIDSKFPYENYNRLVSTTSPEAKKQYQKLFADDVKKHIQTIAQKYIIEGETADFAYLFLPAEALFSYVHAHLESVVQYAFEQHVYFVSPSTLMAYLTAMNALYLDLKRSEHMEEMQTALKQLAVEFERFASRYQSVSKDFEKAYQDMHSLSITVTKLLDRFTRIESVDLSRD